MSLAKFKIKAGVAGHSVLEVNGEDVAQHVQGFRILSGPRDIPQIELLAIGEVEIEGDGVVYIIPSEPDLAKVLDKVDVKKLNDEAMQRMGWDSPPGYTVAHAILDVLKEKLQNE